MATAFAHLGGLWATGVSAVTSDLRALDEGGRWAVLLPYTGRPTLIRFANWGAAPPPELARWVGPAANSWATSMDKSRYVAAVERVRQDVADGTAYQVNICRMLTSELHDGQGSDIAGLHMLLQMGNPAPYSGMIEIPEVDLHVVTASPELFLKRRGSTIESGPIKGTGRSAADLTAKDEAENVMIVDLVRNDLSKVCRTGSVTVPGLLQMEVHPGLVHLVSYVRGELSDGAGWTDILAAAFPAGSITGAPKYSAKRIISELEPVDRGPYCGAMGWIDADNRLASLAVTIRTFWKKSDTLYFGTGAGITWSSDATAEWHETELKAARLTAVASGSWQGVLS